MTDSKLWWIVQLFSCFSLTGLIWVMQLVHYPSFVYIDRARFVEFQRFHEKRITWIVGVLMPADLISAGMLLWSSRTPELWINLGLLLLVWGATAAFSVPCHSQLESGFTESVWRRLVATNWFRTVFWSVRSLLLMKVLLSQWVV
ncbi:MAG: hypothetical protein ACJ763_01660 [Bdellovibrionia bacterium]